MSATVAVAEATLAACRLAGAYHELTLAAPAVAAAARPGQFVSVGVDAPGALLRRPFAIAGVDTAAGTLRLVVAVVGVGSAWLVEQPVGTAVDVVGPLGTAFTAPAGAGRCLLVGGGYGVAPLAWLAADLGARGRDVTVVSGARSADALAPLPRGTGSDGVGGPVLEVTEDGSRGRTGLVTDVLADQLAGGPASVYACGPMPMLAAVARLCAARGAPCQVAVEEHMACSVGVCMTCVVPTTAGNVRACIDGPVMDAADIDWGVALDRHFGRRTRPPSEVLRDDRAPHIATGAT